MIRKRKKRKRDPSQVLAYHSITTKNRVRHNPQWLGCHPQDDTRNALVVMNMQCSLEMNIE